MSQIKKPKQLPEGVLVKKKNFAKLTGTHMCQSFFLIKSQAELFNFIKKRLWHRPFPVNFAKILRTPSFIEHLC